MNDPILMPGGRRLLAEFAGPDQRSACASNNRALTALLGVLAAVLLAISLLAEPAQAAECTDSLQAKINAAPSGGTVTADPCVYREQITIKKPITLQGQPGSEIRGSDVWDEFTQNESGLYVSANALPVFSASGQCKPGTTDCLKPEQVFLDGKPLKQVANGTIPATGQFSLDSGRHVLLGDNPSERAVEVSVRRYWVRGGAAGVTIKGFTMKHAANDSQYRAALSNEQFANWSLEDSKLSDAHGALVSFRAASGLRIVNSELYRGGQLGVHSSDGSLTLSGNKIHDNNTEGFNPSWEAGGAKGSRMSNVLAESNQIYNNDGRGLWSDIESSNITYRDNTIHHNAWSGIFFEVSDMAKIYNNVLWENAWGKSDSSVGSVEPAIHIRNSRNAEVYNNTVAWNRGGISVIRSDRSDNLGEDVYGNYVHDNQVFSKDYPDSIHYSLPARTLTLAWVDTFPTKTLYNSAKNNRGYSNDYYFITSEDSTIPRFRWQTATTSLNSFNATSGEESGRYLSQTEKDAIVLTKGIPISPEH